MNLREGISAKRKENYVLVYIQIAEEVLRSLGWVHSHQRRESLDFPFSSRRSREEKCVARDLTYTAALQTAAESHSPQNNCFHFPYTKEGLTG